ncbi:Myomesin-2 165 kDa connectin-associated protein 165 kDa titin-associated protein M-protein [Triplophysa tibetana]|uniref:Myomesin-2 165 kDa connectin-associated protein 165 kDa titin-associated protein M-protein n=1 Tax=Triplophysa tibetana TaxID=1572043 RepID=A0A5A9NH73_9TELE|nr:Myomesin-2 165 kDa connectin-associated protein 165 kDa titin-associated protein M-protein [Triplophysa tibetana]
MPAKGVTLYRQEQKQHQSSKRVVQHSSTRCSSCQLVIKEQVQASEAMAEPAYTVPTFRERAPEGMQEYQRMSAHFGRDLVQIQQELHRMKVVTKQQVENIEITRQVRGMMQVRKDFLAEVPRAPDFLVSLRPHTVWEKTPVKLFCTVSGQPVPIVKWYKNNVAIEPLSTPGKYKIENKYGVHSLIISRCGLSDSGAYSAVASNPHGKVISKATVCVRRAQGGGELAHLPGLVPLLSGFHASKLEVTLLDKFGVTFGTEGESVSLMCTMVVVPDLPNLPPEAMWYRDDTLLTPSRWAEMSIGGGVAKLTFPHLNKDDEGLYTLRVWTKEGTTEHSAYMFVKDATPTVSGAPGAPMDVVASDVNADYVMISWKTPNTTHEAPIVGYFVDRRKSGTKDWVQCNDSPVKICKLPVHGLTEGASYHFRVRAVNKTGISLASRMSCGVIAGELESDVEVYVTIPEPPTNVHATEINKTYIVLSWTPPSPPGRAPVWYLIEKCVGDSHLWQRVNTAVQLRSPRYPVFDMEDGKTYRFRVITVNKYGSSEPSESTDPIQKVDPHGVPSAPGQVIASRNTKTSAFVKWEAPKHLNNLMGYYVDASVVGSKTWFPCNHRPYKHTRFVVHGLVPGDTYVFRVQAVNTYGLSEESQESEPLFIDAALTTPSAPYGICLLSCDGSSMTLAWKRPKHTGGTKITSYYLDKREAGLINWKEVSPSPAVHRIFTVENLTGGVFYEFKVQAANLAGVGLPSDPSKAFACEAWTMPEPGPAYDISFWEVRDTSLLVTELEAGQSYVFKLRAVNAKGVGKVSDLSDPVCAKALPGTKEIVCGVDEETGDIFLKFEACEVSETSKFTWSKSYKEITESNRVSITSSGRQSKMTFVNAEKEDLGTYSVSVTDTEGVSSSYTINEEELKKVLELSYDIRHPIVPLKTELNYEILEKGHVRFWVQALKLSTSANHRFIVNDKAISSTEGFKISHDVNTGIIQMTIEHFTKANEGTYTIQIHDGKAKSQSSLVLVGDGPHFSEYLTFHVTDDCTVMLVGKLANVKKETTFAWYKDDEEITLDVPPNPMSGSCALPIPMFSRKDHGIYKAVLGDDRGKDTSVYDISGKVFEDIINAVASIAGSSASELVLQCTPEGIRLQCYMKYYTEEIKTSWFHKESKISSSEKMRIGGTSEMAWMQICEPTDKEKAYTDAYAEFQRLKAAAFAEKNRGRVVGGLPDVVTIMEKKTLSLTCTVWGDPSPEVTWFKNEQEVLSEDRYKITFESGKFASLTINTVTVEDSGKFSINVRNKYGGEFVEITVSVYKQGDDIPEPKLGQMSRPAPQQAKTPTPQTPTPSIKSPTPTPPPSVKSPTPSPAPSVKSPTPSPAPKSPTPPRSMRSPTPPRSLRSPTPTKK